MFLLENKLALHCLEVICLLLKLFYLNLESVWEPPSEGYLSLAEQKENANETTRKQFKAIQKHELAQERLRFVLKLNYIRIVRP